MYKVMLVDDETYFRTYLRTTIPWQNYDFEICAEAANGEEGLLKIPFSNPDVILVDINMPIMNGISFSNKVKEKYPSISIILITAYNEFEYARQALRIGVENYILKPFEKQELIDSLVSLKKNIINRKEKDIIISNLQKQYNVTFPVMKNDIPSTKIVNKAKEYIENNYQRSELLIEDIAASVFFHPSYLRFLFKKETGVTIGEYLTGIRMLKAKELLKNGSMRHTEVASLLGYSDAAYFSKCFKKYNNISPSEYERLINQKI